MTKRTINRHLNNTERTLIHWNSKKKMIQYVMTALIEIALETRIMAQYNVTNQRKIKVVSQKKREAS